MGVADLNRKFGWVTPVPGGYYMDIMPASKTEQQIFQCVSFESGKLMMRNVKTNKVSKHGPFDWAEASPPRLKPT